MFPFQRTFIFFVPCGNAGHTTATNMGFCNIGAEAMPISIGSLLGCGSGRRVSIWLFVVIFIISFSIGFRYRAEDFQNPQHRKAYRTKSLQQMNKIDTLPIIQFETTETFETWLVENHENLSGLWMKIFKKDSKKRTITYAEALDVALCFGWIDGQKKTFDEESWLQKFTPRREKSIWSKVNIGHIERLTNEGRMKPAGLKAIEKAKADGKWEKAYDSPSKMTIPEDFLKEISKNKKAEAFFLTLNKTNLFSIGFRLQTAKKQETRTKRMKEIIEMLAKGDKFQ
ncbi:MAG: YdeI/OmpD-associated family protein [Ferruginibacter sp.]